MRKSIYTYLCLFLIGCLLLPNLIGCHSSATNQNVDLDQVQLTSELIEIDVQGDRLMIREITPGLDAYTVSVTLFSLKESKILGKVDLGEGEWQIGWTKKGFYAVTASAPTIRLYNNAGRMTKELDIPQHIDAYGFIMLNDTADTLFYSDPQTANMYVCAIKGNSSRKVGQVPYGYHKPLGFKEDYFYLAGTDELIRVRAYDEYAEAAYAGGVTYCFVDMGICTDEDTISVVLPNATQTILIPQNDSREFPLATNDHGFITVAHTEYGSDLRVYDMQSNRVWLYPTEDVVQQAQFYGNRVIIHTYDGQKNALEVIDPEDHSVTTNNFETRTTTQSTTSTDITVGAQNNTTTKIPPTNLSGTVLAVPILAQFPQFPTGCESVSAVMALRYYGEQISVSAFVNNHLARDNRFYYDGSVYCGPDPYKVFVGDPTNSRSYGCMAPVIEDALISYFGSDRRIKNTTGQSLDALCTTYIDNEMPVLVWATIGMVQTTKGASWRISDGSTFTWPNNEHCMVLIGYSDSHYYFNDPYRGKTVSYPKTLCESRYNELGMQSLVITE